MANYTVKKGDDLEELVGADGVSNTNAVNEGQVQNDGSAGFSAASESAASETSKAPGFEYPLYTPSDTVKQAETLLQQHLASKPGAYTSPWQSQLNDIIQQIQNREKFSYDLNADALYQQYKDQYTTQGRMAMLDTMGQVQAMTGGYGNSYARSAGQQAYQGYLQQLGDRIPELYQLALDQYSREGDAMYDQASLIAGMEEQDYGRYRDSVSDYYTELDRLTSDSRYQAEQDYGKWMDKTELDYGIHRDTVADQQWQAQFDEAKRQYEESKQKSSGGTGAKEVKIPDALRSSLEKSYGDDAAVLRLLSSYAADGSITQEQFNALMDAYIIDPSALLDGTSNPKKGGGGGLGAKVTVALKD